MVQRTKLCRCEDGEESVAMAKERGEKKKGENAGRYTCALHHSQAIRAAEFHELYSLLEFISPPVPYHDMYSEEYKWLHQKTLSEITATIQKSVASGGGLVTGSLHYGLYGGSLTLRGAGTTRHPLYVSCMVPHCAVTCKTTERARISYVGYFFLLICFVLLAYIDLKQDTPTIRVI
ncbi:hypothetical protein EVAR_8611_1 [Eumeta japonica]|uniref:Uncharacterized protein n=1 Tax=Eumeta variegata TaxID=151549 RepID=A0A4C1XGZ7_EUMVA|nr:hypothetical protein EVAR_8611_1 [Eumeta japonica]